jgi:hypothetical protein
VELVTPLVEAVTGILTSVTPVAASRPLARTGAPVPMLLRLAVSLLLLGLVFLVTVWGSRARGDRFR